MNKGYIENGFIVDVTSCKKTSEIIYELSRVLDIPESKDKHICLKLGSINLTQDDLKSIKTLVEVMSSQLAFISTSSTVTLESATSLGVSISEFTNQIEAPSFDLSDQEAVAKNETEEIKAQENVKKEENNSETNTSDQIDEHLEKIFGEQVPQEKIKSSSNEKEITPVRRLDNEAVQIIEEQQQKKSNDDIEQQRNEAESLPTLYLRKTIRSGQSISSDGNIVVIGDVNPGAEIIAKGDITVWGILGGIAHAGSDGNNFARIRALKLHPVQIRIGKIFARRPDTVNIPYVQKTSEYIPEEAFAYEGTIIIRKIHEKTKEI